MKTASGSRAKTTAIYVFMITAFFLSMLVSMRFGAVDLSVGDIAGALANGPGSTEHTIFYKVRLPRVMLGAVAGAGLAMVGAVMQGIFQNPLVDSYTLGMSSGASLGAVIAIVTGISAKIPGISTLSAFAFMGAVGTLTFVYFLSSRSGKVSTSSLLLSGIVVSYFISALISILMMLNSDKIESIVFWNMGSIAGATWTKTAVAAGVIIPCTFILYYFWRELNMMSFGEESASSLGVNTARTKIILLLTSSLIVGTVVSVGGTIGFVGLIAPHIARYFTGAENRKLLFLSALTGSVTLMLADTLGRLLTRPAEIPVGVMTAVIAGPLFIYLLRKNGRK